MKIIYSRKRLYKFTNGDVESVIKKDLISLYRDVHKKVV